MVTKSVVDLQITNERERNEHRAGWISMGSNTPMELRSIRDEEGMPIIKKQVPKAESTYCESPTSDETEEKKHALL